MNTLTETTPPADCVRAAYARWRQAVEAELKGVPFERKLVARTFEGIAVQPIYTRTDTKNLAGAGGAVAAARAGDPSPEGEYNGTAWTSCQEISALDADDFNRRARVALAQGVTALSLRLDRAARVCVDPDQAPAGDLGAEGVSLADLREVAGALNAIDLGVVPVYFDVGATPLPFAGTLLGFLRDRGVALTALRGGLMADPLAEWVMRGELPLALDKAMDDLAGWTKWSAIQIPGLATVGVSGTHWFEAGANAVQELAFTIASAVEYLRALAERGVSATETAERMRFRFATGPRLFTEVAKYRAFRLIWTRVLAAYGVSNTARPSKVHAVTGRWNKSTLDPHVNLLRATTEALSAVLGGADSLHVAAFDELLGMTTPLSERIARNVHTLLGEEFRLAAPVDPTAGSWYVEKLTDELARNAWRLFQEIEKGGGFVAALRAGSLQAAVAATAKEKRQAAGVRRLALVGVNQFPNLKEKPAAGPGELAELCAVRRAALATRRLQMVPSIPDEAWPGRLRVAISLAQVGATLGQLLRAAHPAERVPATVSRVDAWRVATPFEALRSAVNAAVARGGETCRPKVFLAKMGLPVQHKARADFSAGFFAVGGFELLGKQTFESPADAAVAAAESGAAVAVLCSTDETYLALAPVFAKAAKTIKPDLIVVLAGYPMEHVEAFRADGFDEFIHLRADVHETLARILTRMGVPVSS
jgi:methylmalonyl-CoA mutase